MLMTTIGVGAVSALVAFFLGIGYGAESERRYVKAKALTDDSPTGTAMYVDGVFYYVIEEGHFVRHWMRKPKKYVMRKGDDSSPADGGSHTTNPHGPAA